MCFNPPVPLIKILINNVFQFLVIYFVFILCIHNIFILIHTHITFSVNF